MRVGTAFGAKATAATSGQTASTTGKGKALEEEDLEDTLDDQAFIALFKGKMAYMGSSQSWSDTYTFVKGLKGKLRNQTFIACYNFFVHPARFMVEGKSIKASTDPNYKALSVDDKIIELLPISEGPHEVGKTRHDKLKLVNFQMVNRLALLFIEYYNMMSPLTQGWVTKYGNVPSKVTITDIAAAIPDSEFHKHNPKKPNDKYNETVEILAAKCTQFKNDTVYWSLHDWSVLMPKMRALA